MSERNAAAGVSAISNAIDKIGDSLRAQGEAADNEAMTKQDFILPFLRDVLGYNVDSSREVRLEVDADVVRDKGEKVDIAILNDDSEHTPRILIECKKLGVGLTPKHAGQLRRYFDAHLSARFGILTDGRFWRLYTDMDNDNRMDDEPYAILDVRNPNPDVIALLQHLTKEGFDSDKARKDAERYCKKRLIYRNLRKELSDPSLEFVRFLAGELTKGKHDPIVETEYKPLVVDALEEYKSRLKKAEMDEEGSDSQQRGAEESDDAAAVGTGTAEPGEAEQKQPERKPDSSVRMQDLVNAGLLHDGDKLICATAIGRYQDVVATVHGDGKIEIEGQPYPSPSRAAKSVTGSSRNGWKFWRLLDGRTLGDLRDAYDRGFSVHD